MVLFIWCVLLACSSSIEPDWSTKFQKDPNQTIAEIRSLSDPLQQEHIALSLLSSTPEQAVVLCELVRTKIGQQTCSRFQNRPHLWTIQSNDAAFWNGGRLGERLVFPRDFRVDIHNDPTLSVSDCQKNQVCLRTRAEEVLYTDDAAKTNWEVAAQYCLAIEEQRSRYDCLFHLSESLPVHINNYRAGVALCALAKPYAGECHNHLLLRFSSSFWTKLEWHEQLLQEFQNTYDNQVYVQELSDAYWSIVAFRVVGMMMPLQVASFLEWPSVFQPHLRSAVALRVWDAPDPIFTARRAFNRESQRVSKARGPGAPRFRARPVWKTQNDNLSWIRFCDLRGGFRPVHEEPEIDLIWAILTASAMTEPLNISFWANIDQERWEVRWAIAHLLKELGQKDNPLYAQLRQDDDRRVRMVLQ